jgi:ATP-binding protein involved in chromosome partitioning
LSVTQQQVLDALSKVKSPRGVALPHANVLSAITASDGKVFFSINVDAAEARAWEDVRAQAEAAVRAIPGVSAAMIALTAERKAGSATPPPVPQQPHRHTPGHSHGGGVQPAAAHRPPQGGQNPMSKQAEIPGIAAVIAVASGKGGVGKSTTALNLALGLRDQGLRVGLLDADIYGPSVPRLTGIREKPQLNADRKMIPITRFGLSIMSIGFLVEEDTAMIWRGPMVMSAITQMNVPLKGAIIISTPQDLSLIDARRGLAMFKKVNVPVLGIVENMSYFQCPQCGTRSDIFGHGGARHEADALGVPFLGEIPLHMSIRATSDAGTPVVDSEPDGPHAAIYRAIGAKVREQLQGVIAAA